MPDFMDNQYTPPNPLPGVDASRPSAARMYDLMLGGKDNFAADRQALDELLRSVPELRSMAITNRHWLARIVRFLAEQGIEQFLDIGSGLPAQNPTHQVAHRHARGPAPRVVYVDHDAMVCSHARALLAEQDPSATTVIHADLRTPAQILTHPDLGALIDLTRPVAVLLVAVLHFLPDDQHPHQLVRALRDALAPGSVIAISHVDTARSPERAAFLEEFYTERGIPGQTRSPREIARFFDGLELVAPGLGYIERWRPEHITAADPAATAAPMPTAPGPAQVGVYGGLGRVPEPDAPAGITTPPAEA